MPVLVGLIPGVALLGMNLAVATAERVPAGDFAVLEIATRNAIGGDQLLGAYSRYGWRHPGPALFYWSAPFYRLSGERLGGLVVASTTISVLSIGFILVSLQRLAGRATAWVGAATVVVMWWLIGVDHVQSPWNSDVLILPTAACAVAGSAAVAGRRWALPVAAVLASWVVQAHLGAVPVMLTLGVGIGALTAWRQRRSLGRWLAPAAVATVAVAGIWAPVVWEELTRSPGNLTEIRRFYDSDADGPHAWTDSIGAVASAVTGHQDEFADGEPVPTVYVVGALGLVAVVCAGAAVGWIWHRGRPAVVFQAALCTFGMLGTVAAVFSVRNIDGPILRHLLSFASGLGLVLWLGAAVTVASSLTPFADRRWLRITALGPALVLTGALVVEVLSVGPWNRNPDFPATAAEVRHRLAVDNEQAATTAAVALRSPLVRPGSRVEVTWPAGWEIGAGVVNALQKEGVRATVPADVSFIFGDELTSDGSETARVVIVPERERGAYPPHWKRPPEQRFRIDDGLGYQVFVVPLDP